MAGWADLPGVWCLDFVRWTQGKCLYPCDKASNGLLKLFDRIAQVRKLVPLHPTPALYVVSKILIVEGENLFKVCVLLSDSRGLLR